MDYRLKWCVVILVVVIGVFVFRHFAHKARYKEAITACEIQVPLIVRYDEPELFKRCMSVKGFDYIEEVSSDLILRN